MFAAPPAPDGGFAFGDSNFDKKNASNPGAKTAPTPATTHASTNTTAPAPALTAANAPVNANSNTTFTLEEVSRHHSREDEDGKIPERQWTIVNNKVYDISISTIAQAVERCCWVWPGKTRRNVFLMLT